MSSKGKITEHAVSGQAVSMSKMTYEVTNLTPTELDKTITQLIEAMDWSYYALGAALSAAQSNSKNWLGHPSWEEYVEMEHGFSVSKAKHLISIYQVVLNSHIEPSELAKIGWTKMRMLVSGLKHYQGNQNAEGMSALIDMANTTPIPKINEAQKKLMGSEMPTKKVKTSEFNIMTFKLHDDQKTIVLAALERAKKEVHTEYNTVALDAICNDFLAGPQKKPAMAPPLEDQLKKLGYMEVLKIFGELFPTINLDVHLPDETEQAKEEDASFL